MSPNGHEVYRTMQVATASQQQLIFMLYKGVLKFGEQARDALRANDAEESNRMLQRVQDILVELMSSLNFEVSVANQLYQVYEYMHHQVVQANVQKSCGPLDEVMQLMGELKDTWSEVFSLEKEAKSGHGGGGVSVAG